MHVGMLKILGLAISILQQFLKIFHNLISTARGGGAMPLQAPPKAAYVVRQSIMIVQTKDSAKVLSQ